MKYAILVLSLVAFTLPQAFASGTHSPVKQEKEEKKKKKKKKASTN